MKLLTIVADSVAEALAEVNRQLGPTAVIVNVRRTSSGGLSRIWKKPQIEVQATVPEQAQKPETKPKAPPPKPQPEPGRPDRPVGLDPGTRKRPSLTPRPTERPASFSGSPRSQGSIAEIYGRPKIEPAAREPQLNLTQMLENLGLLPLHVQWLKDQLRQREGGGLRGGLREEFGAVQQLLVNYWNRLAGGFHPQVGVTRILIGTSGVGKTTCLCKWLTQEVLFSNQKARVWRLDGTCANTAEFLSIHGEILGVPVERVWSEELYEPTNDVQFVDLPGVSAQDLPGIAALKPFLKHFEPAQFYLVLNAAYDLSHLLDHVKAFSVLPISGLILTHLDEDRRWGKFWNLLLGTRVPVVYLSADQNIPGDFTKAAPSSLFDLAGDQGLES
ncbi:MAG: hypothetical protein K9N62_02265 [Verrucomicrobia bacterium]|nr:hypothetical protein [Verrucomicrobiota bacterium]